MADFVPAGEEYDDFDDGFILDCDELGDVNTHLSAPVVGLPKHNNTKQNKNDKQLHQPKSPQESSKIKFKFTLEDFRAAAMKRDMNKLVECLKQGIPIDTVLQSGWTALMYAANSSNPDLVAFLLVNGANPNFQTNKYSVLMAACGSHHNPDCVFECVRLLIEKGANINDYDRYHISPLLYAAREGQIEVVKFLLNHGASINKQDSRGWTALSWATHRHHVDVVLLLLNEGCNKLLRHTDGLLPVDLAIGQDNQQLIALLEGKPLPQQQNSTIVNGDTKVNGTTTNGVMAETNHLDTKIRDPPIKLENGAGDCIPQTQVKDSNYCFTNTAKRLFNTIREAINSQSKLKTQTTSANQDEATGTSINQGNEVVSLTDYDKFGELELFLSGLGFKDFNNIFQEQQVDFEMFLCLNEDDLINMGIKQIGVRKKLLEGIQTVHKKEWETTSLISPRYNKHISCVDAVAMVSNISKHILYISSSIVFISDQLKQNPELLTNIEGNISPSHLVTQTNDAYQNVTALKTHLTHLQKRLNKEMKMIECKPPDLIQKHKKKTQRILKIIPVVVLVSTVGLLVWKRESVNKLLGQIIHKYS
ncbi:ankyrin repeat, SAM and basic leucine zipper domain-containing protein 1 [Patella vulgata]|uniref:ankyrin repeat, SAM and basic leucine zipper domain-containing protein 1 n=1 Tax=Patella vulgata TaxID=6465 RepID=UPI00217F6667|nr:ankyrin repeat, SAM and basic leucine zipper domain-containing protein 1 [Patella vulgata]